MSRAELADAVNLFLRQLDAPGDVPYVDNRWVDKLERGEYRWPGSELRTALRHVLGAATDIELGLSSPRRTAETN
ncbi:hypothetical protein [Micromonospora sp. WMMD1082]|uniref:hypothetical protein n=1 Tax=Micromonospora sp. WMMD1082 TaxID=3016104 RepID=UPI002416AD30|nr:hypothetical protein [Micromonospora sp. WMMD1082]MDG4795164.1 hypothetical protein [Micromonospora sp. WMMD1082]